jgi:hypothetical protein
MTTGGMSAALPLTMGYATLQRVLAVDSGFAEALPLVGAHSRSAAWLAFFLGVRTLRYIRFKTHEHLAPNSRSFRLTSSGSAQLFQTSGSRVFIALDNRCRRLAKAQWASPSLQAA